jgi:hypothetical protein
MGWEGTESEEFYSTPERIDPFPFTTEGRLYQRIEHELRAAEAAIMVGSLVLEKSAIRARKRRDQRLR